MNVKKTEAHRKRVAEKAKKKEMESTKITISSIQEDRSDGKAVSHAQLVALVRKNPNVFETTAYSENEQSGFCQMYGVTYRKS